MLKVIMLHLVVHGGWPFSNSINFANVFLPFFGMGGGVNIFMIMTGYFLVQREFKLKSLLKFMLACLLHSSVLLIVLMLFCDLHFDKKTILKALLPLGMFNWFAYAYIIMYLFLPLINRLLLNISKSMHFYFLIVGALIWYAIPTIAGVFKIWVDFNFSSLPRMAFCYAIGAFIKLYCDELDFSKAWRYLLLLLLVYGILNPALYFASVKFKFLEHNITYFSGWNSIIALSFALLMFLCFKSLKVPHNKFINIVASTTFGIYLIHDSDLFRHYLWHNLLRVARFYNSDHLVFHVFISVAVVFVVCGIIEFMRVRFIERTFFAHYGKQIDAWQSRIVAMYNTCFTRYFSK